MKTTRAVLIVLVLSLILVGGLLLSPAIAVAGWVYARARGGMVADGLRADLAAMQSDRDNWRRLYRRTLERAALEETRRGKWEWVTDQNYRGN